MAKKDKPEPEPEESIELHDAFFFICPNCGKENYKRALAAEMSKEEEASIKAEMGIDPWQEGQFVMAPDKVECKKCKKRFVVERED